MNTHLVGCIKLAAILTVVATTGIAAAHDPEAEAGTLGISAVFNINGSYFSHDDFLNGANASKTISPTFQNYAYTKSTTSSIDFYYLTGSFDQVNSVAITQDSGNVHSEASSELSNIDFSIGTGISVTGSLDSFSFANLQKGVPTSGSAVASKDLKIVVLGQEIDVPSDQPKNSVLYDSLDSHGDNGLKILYGRTGDSATATGANTFMDGFQLEFFNFDDNGTIIKGSMDLGYTTAQAGIPSDVVSEPMSMAAFGVGALGLLLRRRKHRA